MLIMMELHHFLISQALEDGLNQERNNMLVMLPYVVLELIKIIIHENEQDFLFIYSLFKKYLKN
jgi:hypothetical protein